MRELLAQGALVEVAQAAHRLAQQVRTDGDLDRAARLLDDALESIDFALADAAALGPTESSQLRFVLPYLLLERAEVARGTGRWDESLELLDLAEQACLAQASTVALQSDVVGLRAQNFLDQGLFDLAARWIDREFALREPHRDDPLAMLPAHLRRSNLRYVVGRFDLQIVELQPVLAALDALPEPSLSTQADRAQLALRLAIALQEVGTSDEAGLERARRELEGIWGSTAADSVRRDSARRLALQDLREGEPESAAIWLSRAREELERATRHGHHASDAERTQQAALELRLIRAQGASREALERAAAHLGVEVDRLLQTWLSQPSRAAGLGYLRDDTTRSNLTELMSAQVALHGEEAGAALALATWARAEAAGSLHRTMGARLPGLAEIQAALLPPDTGALVFVPNVDRPLVLTVDAAEGARVFEIASEREIAPVSMRWSSEIVRSPAGLSKDARAERAASLATRGRSLSTLLLPAPVVERLRRWSTVHVVGAEFLDDLAFEALPIEGLGPLGRARAVGYLPSLAIGVHLAERAAKRQPPEIELLGVSGVRATPGGGTPRDLPFGPDEFETLTEGLRGPVRALLGPAATLAGLREADLGRARVVLFLTHGLADPARERSQGLRLSDGQVLWSEDAEGLPGPRLAILAVCEAGRGPQREGDGPAASLGGAFLRGGVDCTVISGAEQAYESTLRLSTELLRALEDGRSVAEGMRIARDRVAGSEASADPYYWALIRALGLAHRPVR